MKRRASRPFGEFSPFLIFIFLFSLLFIIILRKILLSENLIFFIFINFLAHFLKLIFILIAFYGLGRIILRKFPFSSFIENFVFSVAGGSGVFSLLLLLIGMSGYLKKELAYPLIGAFFLWGVWEILKDRVSLSAFFVKGNKTRLSSLSMLHLLFIVFSLAIVTFGTLSPPLSYDALAYHLAIPKIYVEKEKIVPLPYHLYSNFPFNMEMLYTLSLLLFNDYSAKSLHALMGVLIALSLFSFSLRVSKKEMGIFSALLFLSLPLTYQLMTLAYNDLFLSLLLFLALYSLLFWKGKEGAIMGGIFSGLAMGTKYTGIIFAFPFFILYLLISHHKNLKEGIKYSFLYLFFSLLLFSPWLIKNFYYTHNPLFPLFYSVLDGKNFSPSLYERFLKVHLPPSHSGRLLFYSLWRIATESKFGFFFLPLSPLLLTLKKNKEEISLLLYFLYIWLIWFHFTHQDARFLIPALPPLILLYSLLLYRFPYRRTSIFLHSIVIFLVIFNLVKIMAYATYYDFWKVPLRIESRREYLREKLYYYPALEFINKNLPKNSYLLFVGANQTYYCQKPFFSSSPLDKNFFADLIRKEKDAKKIYQELKKRGFTHLFINQFEIKRTEETYRSFDWDKEEWETFNLFLNKYTHKLFEKEGVIVSEIL